METTKTTKTATAAQSKSLDPATGDRLSSLPDEILSHILSYLPTKHAVGTAVLSRRWKDPWTMVSNLDFDNRLVHKSRLAGIHRRDSEFCRFVDRVLAQHKSLNSLRRFRFHLSVSYCNFEPSRGFWSTMEPEFGSQLEEIDVKLESDDRFGAFRKLLPPPVSLYTLGSLRVLKLAGVAIMMSTTHDSVFLPSLEILQLLLVRTMDCESLHMLISGCPVLETVHIENCYFLDETEKKTLIAVLPCLKNLKIINYYESHCNPLSPIAVEAPSLEHLHLENSTMLPFMGGSPLSCLHSGWVDIGDRQSLLDDHRSMIRLLPQISDNAKEIYLSRKTIVSITLLFSPMDNYKNWLMRKS
ncbi:unnamed protein product [Linum tenue]|uniref:F-box domain-containing protein n=1 Tax=Linum tenue TaxID=586396 RepID=A0AAV0PA49_9ROSI|nr:unnamed protein product [Linum tenue]